MGCCSAYYEKHCRRNDSAVWYKDQISEDDIKVNQKFIEYDPNDVNASVTTVDGIKLNPLAYAIYCKNLSMVKHLTGKLGASFQAMIDLLESQNKNVFEYVIQDFDVDIFKYCS